MTIEEDILERLKNIEEELVYQSKNLRSIKTWLVFFGILTIIGMFFGGCSALLSF